jgi:hypothetical protein
MASSVARPRGVSVASFARWCAGLSAYDTKPSASGGSVVRCTLCRVSPVEWVLLDSPAFALCEPLALGRRMRDIRMKRLCRGEPATQPPGRSFVAHGFSRCSLPSGPAPTRYFRAHQLRHLPDVPEIVQRSLMQHLLRERDPEESLCIFRPGGARPPSEVMVGFIDDLREQFGVEPICRVFRWPRPRPSGTNPGSGIRRGARHGRNATKCCAQSSVASGTSTARCAGRGRSGGKWA